MGTNYLGALTKTYACEMAVDGAVPPAWLTLVGNTFTITGATEDDLGEYEIRVVASHN